jgi:hypothetical protein
MKRYDRAAVMRDAHKQMRQSKRLGLGWDWSRCLRFAWHKAKGKKEIEYGRLGRRQHAASSRSLSSLAWRGACRDSNVGACL